MNERVSVKVTREELFHYMPSSGIVGEVTDAFEPEPEEGPPPLDPLYKVAIVGRTPTQAEAAGIEE